MTTTIDPIFEPEALRRPTFALDELDMDALASLIAQSGWGSDPLSAALISWMTNLFDFRVESHASGTADKSSSSSTFHWKNQFKLEMSGTSARQKTSNAPKSAPPEGAEIVDFF